MYKIFRDPDQAPNIKLNEIPQKTTCHKNYNNTLLNDKKEIPNSKRKN